VSLWRQLARGYRTLTDRSTVDGELDDEVRDYFERACADLVRQGLSPQEAARAARLELGDVARAREELRSYGWENAAEATLADLRQAVRRLRQSPSFTLVAVLTLALGIGASTAIFSAVAPILFEPLPYPNADRVVMLTDRDGAGAPLDVAYGTYIEIAERSRSFESLAVADRWQPALVGGGESERLVGEAVSAGYFGVLGVAPALGRDFDAADDVFRGLRVAIVSDGLAKRRFGSARAILNETIRLDDADYTVIGVMPAGFDNVLAPTAEVWTPRQYRAQAPFESAEWGHHMRMIGRLATGVSVEQARTELAAIAGSEVSEFPRPPWARFESGLIVESLQGSVTAGARPVLLAMMGAVLLLLVIACANVTNLILARSVARRSELAVRAALGAGRARLVRQLLTESLLLAFLGGAVGLGVAIAGIQGIVALAPAGLPRIDAVRLDVQAFLFALAVTTLVGLAVGLTPALRGARPNLRLDLHAGARAALGSHHVLRRALVVTEVALALVLLVGAGLLLRSVDRLLSTPPGFDTSDLITMQFVAPG
jgi:predicted permease